MANWHCFCDDCEKTFDNDDIREEHSTWGYEIGAPVQYDGPCTIYHCPHCGSTNITDDYDTCAFCEEAVPDNIKKYGHLSHFICPYHLEIILDNIFHYFHSNEEWDSFITLYYEDKDKAKEKYKDFCESVIHDLDDDPDTLSHIYSYCGDDTFEELHDERYQDYIKGGDYRCLN